MFGQCAADDCSLKNLEENTLVLPESSNFNDPFDCYFDWNINEIFDDSLVCSDRETAQLYINS